MDDNINLNEDSDINDEIKKEDSSVQVPDKKVQTHLQEDIPIPPKDYQQQNPSPNQNFHNNPAPNFNDLKEKAPSILFDFLSFDKMITPTIIKIIYYIGIAGSVITSLIIIAGALVSIRHGVLRSFFAVIIGAPLFLVSSLLILRVSCEYIILQFEKHKLLKEIEKNTKK